MTRGVQTPEEKVAEFRAHYLWSGNATESAKAVGIPDRTARDIVERLVEDPTFAADRRKLRVQALDELVSMRMRVARKALERYEEEGPEIPEGAEGVTIIDKRPDHGRLVMDAEKNAHNLAKMDDPERDQAGTKSVTIHITGPSDKSVEID